MRLHENKQLFADAINAASRPKNGSSVKCVDACRVERIALT